MDENSISKITILVVDDSWVIRQYLSKLIKEKTDYQVIEAVDGKDALAKILAYKPDCILLDLLMPNMNGIELLQNISDKGIKIPTIFLSADIQNTTRQRCMDMGAFAFVNKPPKESELLAMIKKALELHDN